MARVARLVGLIVVGLGLVVWSELPATLAEESTLTTETAQPILGYFYEFQFLDPLTRQEVTMQQFGEGVILHAHIEDASHNPATTGSVVFQYCSLSGPSNDITRVDEVPLEKCDSGEAKWARLGSRTVNTSGNADLEFCCPMITPTIGFRFTFSGERGSIPKFTSLPENFNWGP